MSHIVYILVVVITIAFAQENDARLYSRRHEKYNKEILDAIGSLKRDLLASQIQLVDTRCGRKNAKPNPGVLQKQRGRDCEELRKKGIKTSGVYQIWPYTYGHRARSPILAYCDMTTEKGGWTVFQQRTNPFVNFFRGWHAYKEGFGNPLVDHWLGNDVIHELTKRRKTEMRIDMETWDGKKAYAKYSTFFLDTEMEKYKLHIAGFSGNAGDSLKYHNGRYFTTYDKDHDAASKSNCAITSHGAWWYGNCVHSNLNGRYMFRTLSSSGVYWSAWKGNSVAIMQVTMMLRTARGKSGK